MVLIQLFKDLLLEALPLQTWDFLIVCCFSR